jgi:hypothetical protein
MSAGRTIGITLLGLLLGAVAGGVVGLLGGLAYTELAGTSGFEGKSGFVVLYWIFAGMIAGLVAGFMTGLKWSHRQA